MGTFVGNRWMEHGQICIEDLAESAHLWLDDSLSDTQLSVSFYGVFMQAFRALYAINEKVCVAIDHGERPMIPHC